MKVEQLSRLLNECRLESCTTIENREIQSSCQKIRHSLFLIAAGCPIGSPPGR